MFHSIGNTKSGSNVYKNPKLQNLHHLALINYNDPGINTDLSGLYCSTLADNAPDSDAVIHWLCE